LLPIAILFVLLARIGLPIALRIASALRIGSPIPIAALTTRALARLFLIAALAGALILVLLLLVHTSLFRPVAGVLVLLTHDLSPIDAGNKARDGDRQQTLSQ
jgi:hypothetical protein